MINKFKNIITGFFLMIFVFSPIEAWQEENRDAKWFPFYIPWNYCEGSRIDFSFLLDAPAGKHGFLTVKGGHFYFEDGTRAKFWGLNIHSGNACFPTHVQAEDIARRLAQLGCNIVRLHVLDYEAPGGLIDTGRDDSQHFSDSQWDKLDYFIYQLKMNGIYICFDVFGLGARRFKSGDNVPEFDKLEKAARGASFFNKRIIELSKKFASEFLGHRNPYTGNKYIEEPAIAMVEMANENTLFYKRIISEIPSYYKREAGDIWQGWLGKNNLKNMDRSCFDDRYFLYELEDNYKQNMYGYLRSIGVKVPIGGSNIPYDSLNLATESRMDFTDMHVYWDLCDKLDRIHNRPLIKQHHSNPRTLTNTISIAKVHNKPLISTEWGSNWPNDWRAVDILTTASYAALNDWDALFLYSYNGGWSMSWDALERRLYYGTVIFNDPAKMGLFPIASLIFLRGDVSEALNTYRASYVINRLFDMGDSYGDRSRLAGIPYISKLEKDFIELENEEANSGIIYPSVDELSTDDGIIESDTGEIIRDFKKGIFILKTPLTFSFSGFLGKEAKQEFDGISFYTNADFATLTITSLDGKRISRSRHLLLAVVGRVRNKGQRFTPHITKRPDDVERDVYILERGEEPILVEDIQAEIFIKKEKSKERLSVFPLDEKGLRKAGVPVNTDNKRYSFKVSGTAYNTMYYEIVKD